MRASTQTAGKLDEKGRLASETMCRHRVEPTAFECVCRRADWSPVPIETDSSRRSPQVVRIGGSRAQRDLLTNTLLAAYVHADRRADAMAFLDRVEDRQPSRPVAGLAAA